MESEREVVRRAPVSRRHAQPRFTGKEFPVGESITRAFSIYGRNALVLLPLAAAFHALPTLLSYWYSERIVAAFDGPWNQRRDAMPGVWDGLAVTGAGYFFSLALQAVVTYAVFQSLRGAGPSWGRSVARGAARLPAALATSLAVLVGFAVPAFGLLLFGGMMGLFGGMLVGGIGALVWGCLVGSTLFVAVQVAVVEGGVFRAISRSSKLTQRVRWKMLAVLLLFYFVPGLLFFALERLVFSAGEFSSNWQASVFTKAAIGVVFSGLQAVAATVVYHDLRRAREGVGVADLVKVFE